MMAEKVRAYGRYSETDLGKVYMNRVHLVWLAHKRACLFCVACSSPPVYLMIQLFCCIANYLKT